MTLPHATTAALTRACREDARRYGAEARRHFAECAWTEVRPGLEAGWMRMRLDAAPWDAVCMEVHAGWDSVQTNATGRTASAA